MASNGELKHLSFVKEQTTALYSKVAEFYAASKGYVPGPINEVLAKAEAVGATVFVSIADNGDKALSGLDSRVRSLCGSVRGSSRLLRLRPLTVVQRPCVRTLASICMV